MWFFLVLFVFGAGTSAISHSSIGDLPGKISPRIVGGQQTTIERFPWQLSLRIHGSHRCGASVISENRALTAAHCRRNDNSADFTVLGGSTLRFGDQHSFIIRLNRFIQHPNFNNLTMENDIAVLWLERKFVFSPKIQSVNLPKQNEPLGYGSSTLISGWGFRREGDASTAPQSLHFTSMNVLSNMVCLTVYGEWFKEGMFCSGVAGGGRDACQGDSGGPLTKNGVQIGIASWGTYCGSAKFPGVYSNIALYRKWIDSVL